MSELTDYSGEFDPEFSHAKLSKEILLKLREAYAEYIQRIDGLWYLAVKEKWGNDEAFKCDIAVWEKSMLFELKAISTTLNIKGDDVTTVLKYLQCNPWFALNDYEIEVKDKDYATISEYNCPTLLALEKEGKGREKIQCKQVCPRIVAMRADFFNPKIKFTQIKSPPREDKSDICCQWDLKLEED